MKLTQSEHFALGLQETSVPAAYDSFLRGWAHYRRMSPEDLAKAICYFEEFIGLDPNYARAHAALAMVYFLAYDEGWSGTLGITADEVFRKSRDALKLAKARRTSTSHQVAGGIFRSRGWHDDALKEFRAAIDLDPNDAWSYAYLAFALIHAGRPAEAVAQIEIAMRLDPYYPPLFDFYQGLAQFEQNQMAEAAITLKKAAQRSPSDPRPLLYLAAAYAYLQRENEAAEMVANYSSARVKQGGVPFVMAELISGCASFRPPPGSPLVRGLLKVGLPYNFDSASDDLVLTTGEVEALFFGHRLRGRTLESGQEHGVSVAPDGTTLMFGDWGGDIGTAQIIGGRFFRSVDDDELPKHPTQSRRDESGGERVYLVHRWAHPFSRNSTSELRRRPERRTRIRAYGCPDRLPSSFDVVGGRDEVVVFLGVALESEKIPIAAIVLARKVAAGPGPRLIDGAAARLDVEELADAAVIFVLLAPHHALVAVGRFEELLFRFLDREAEILGDAVRVAVAHFDDRIGAAIAGAFQAVIFLSGHGLFLCRCALDAGKLPLGLGHLGLQPFAKGARGSRFLYSFGAHDAVAAVVLQVERERAHQASFNDGVRAQDLITERETLARFRCLDGEMVLEDRAAPVLDTGDAGGSQPIGPPLLALLMQQSVVGQIGRGDRVLALDEPGTADGEAERVRELDHLDVIGLGQGVADTDIGLSRAEVHQPRFRIDHKLDVGMQLIEAAQPWDEPAATRLPARR